MPRQPILRLKQGAVLALDLLIADDEGNAVSLAAATVSVVIADPFGNPVATLPVTPAASPGYCSIISPTTTWPVGRLAGEVHVTVNGSAQISDTFGLLIERTVTQ